jgi:hypothetical protein
MVNVLSMSTTLNPVTHTAEVTVNAASIQEIQPDFVENGILSMTVPTTMVTKKLINTRVAGCSLRTCLRNVMTWFLDFTVFIKSLLQIQ